MCRSVLNTENGKSVQRANKWWVVAYFVLAIVLCVTGLIPLGYSEQGNDSFSINFMSDESKSSTVRVDTRKLSESYSLTASENVQVDGFQIVFSAPNEKFQGILTATISDEEGVLDQTTVALASTGSRDVFAVANGVFGVSAQLKKNVSYILTLRIDTNEKGNYYLKVNRNSNAEHSLHIDGTGKGVLSSVTYTPITPVMYWKAFYGFIWLYILLGGYFLLVRLGYRITNNEIVGRIFSAFQDHYSEIILFLTFVFLALYEFYFAYVKEVFISPDSSNYLQEANALLHGYGFNYLGQSGYSAWFSKWPIGYPALIALTAFCTGRNVYLASKILSVIFVGLTLLFLYLRFKKQAWIFTFCLFNIGFIYIYKYTWSENPFIFGLILFCLIFEQVLKQNQIKIRWFVMWGFSSAFLVLCRYFGVFSLIFIGLAFLYYLCSYIYGRKVEIPVSKRKMLGTLLSGAISSIIVGIFFIMNYLKVGYISGVERSTRWWDDYASLTTNYYNALIAEIGNAIRGVLPETLSNVSQRFHVLTIVFLLALIIYRVWKNKSKDYKSIFIGLGLFYYLVFTFVRYHSSMDPFDPRFLSPASMLITIGILGYLVPFLNQHEHRIAPVVIGLLLIFISGLSYNLKNFDVQTTAYAQVTTSLKNAVKDVPERSVILYSTEIDDRTRVFRPDLYLSGKINPADTMDALFQRYSKSEYICVKAKYIKQILNYPVYDYDSSVVEFFSEIPLDMPDEKYIVISVDDRKIVL